MGIDNSILVLLSLAVSYALLVERRERENPPFGCLIDQALAPWVARLPRLRRACPSAALDERVLWQ